MSDISTHQFGWRWGPVEIVRVMEDPKGGYILRVQAARTEEAFEIRVSPKGQRFGFRRLLWGHTRLPLDGPKGATR